MSIQILFLGIYAPYASRALPVIRFVFRFFLLLLLFNYLFLKKHTVQALIRLQKGVQQY